MFRLCVSSVVWQAVSLVFPVLVEHALLYVLQAMDHFDAHVHPLGALVSAACSTKKIVCGGARLYTLSAESLEDPTVTDSVSLKTGAFP